MLELSKGIILEGYFRQKASQASAKKTSLHNDNVPTQWPSPVVKLELQSCAAARKGGWPFPGTPEGWWHSQCPGRLHLERGCKMRGHRSAPCLCPSLSAGANWPPCCLLRTTRFRPLHVTPGFSIWIPGDWTPPMTINLSKIIDLPPVCTLPPCLIFYKVPDLSLSPFLSFHLSVHPCILFDHCLFSLLGSWGQDICLFY